MRPSLPVLIGLLFAGTLLSGCLGDDDPATSPPANTGAGDVSGKDAAPAAPAHSVGSVRVETLNPDLQPIEGVKVVIDNFLRLSDSAGVAFFDDVPPGAYNITASKDGWRTAQAAVTVRALETSETRVKLLPPWLANDPVVPEDQAYQRDYEFHGVFQCSLTTPIIPGDCLTAVDFAFDEACTQSQGQVCLPIHPGEQTEEQYTFDFPLDRGWETVIVEQVWTPVIPTDGTGNQMQLAVEPTEYAEAGHAPKYARVVGGSPLYLRMDRGVPHETADVSADGDTPGMPNPDGGEVLRTRTYITGAAHNPAGTAFHGVGAAYGQKFSVYVTVFYGEPAADGYSGTPPS